MKKCKCCLCILIIVFLLSTTTLNCFALSTVVDTTFIHVWWVNAGGLILVPLTCTLYSKYFESEYSYNSGTYALNTQTAYSSSKTYIPSGSVVIGISNVNYYNSSGSNIGTATISHYPALTNDQFYVNKRGTNTRNVYTGYHSTVTAGFNYITSTGLLATPSATSSLTINY